MTFQSILPVLQQDRQGELGLGCGGNQRLCKVKVAKGQRVLALAHQRLQDSFMLPLKLTLRGSWM